MIKYEKCVWSPVFNGGCNSAQCAEPLVPGYWYCARHELLYMAEHNGVSTSMIPGGQSSLLQVWEDEWYRKNHVAVDRTTPTG